MKNELVCTICGYAGEARQKARGNGLVEFLLWCFFLFPGILYSLWSRGGKKKNVCSKCGSEDMIPQDTPLGQKLMSEHTQAPQMTTEQLVEQKTINAHNRKVLWIALAIFFGFPILLGAIAGLTSDGENQEKEVAKPVQTTLQENTAQQNFPTESKARIEAIVKNLGTTYEVTLFGKNPNVKAVAPFEVIINTDTGNCALAKQMNFDLMKALYTDAEAKKSIARVRFNARRYLSTSLGGDDARELSDKSWEESGPTNFLKVLTQMGSGDLSFKDMERQTWGKPLEGCQ